MTQSSLQDAPTTAFVSNEIPLTVKEAARYLGVSPQTVYLWVERKQIPHLRVMGRNIRFLKSDLDSFRASSRRERWGMPSCFARGTLKSSNATRK